MTADNTVWKETEGDHADDPSYRRAPRDPNAMPTDEKRTQEDIEDAEQQNKEDEKKRAEAEKAAAAKQENS